VIIHCCYHKVGTVWFGRVLREVAAEYGMRFSAGSDYGKIRRFEQQRDSDIFLDLGSHVDLDKLPDYVGSHMIRDPRDVVVSGYFYHLWTDEAWANLPLAEFRGMSYREYLNSVDQNEGLLTEIRRVSFWVPHMVNWDYQNPRVFEIRYEDILQAEETTFGELFAHYGFSEEAVERCCRIAARYSFRSLSKGAGTSGRVKSHLRSGRSGEWRELFHEEHKQLFKELYPGAVAALGYEKDDSW
jgi:hypothetical protein